jgi:hypothetical protein
MSNNLGVLLDKSPLIVISTGAKRRSTTTHAAYCFECPIANRIPARKVNGSDGYPIGPMC